MNIHSTPILIYSQIHSTRRNKTKISVRFKGEDAPPKMPEFLKPFKKKSEEYLKKNKMSPLKTAALVLGALAGIVGLTVVTHVFMPIVLAGLATFAGVFVLVMALFNQVDKPVKLPAGVKPMTLEQMVEANKYQKELNKYKRNQIIKKAKNFFGIK